MHDKMLRQCNRIFLNEKCPVISWSEMFNLDQNIIVVERDNKGFFVP